MHRSRAVRQVARAACGLWFALCATGAGAQVLPFRVYGLDDGLPQSQVNAVTQDGEGFVWVGTQGGLARFDGLRFASYFVEDGLPGNRVQELLFEPASATLWIATGSGLARWKGHALSRVDDPLLAGVRCRALALDARGALWVGTDRGLLRRDGDRFVPVGAAQVIHDVAADGDALLVGSEAGLFRVEGDALRALAAADAVGGPVSTVAADAGGPLLGTTTTGLWRWTVDGVRRVASVTARAIYRIDRVPSGALYVSTSDAGLFVRAPGQAGFEAWTTRRGLPADVVNQVHEDHQGNLWVATDIGGLGLLAGRGVANFAEADGLPSRCVFGIRPDLGGAGLWVATMKGAALLAAVGGLGAEEAGVVRRSPHGTGDGLSPAPEPVGPRALETLAAELPNPWVWSVLPVPGPRGPELWIHTDGGLVSRAAGSRALAPAPDVIATAATVIEDLELDSAGRLWIARRDLRGGLVVRGADGRWRALDRRADGAPLLSARRLLPRRKGGVWLTDEQQVLWSDGERVEALPGPVPISGGSYLSTILEDSRGRLWVGSDAGLAIHESGRWRGLHDQPGLLDRRFYALGEDATGTVWAGTARGFYRIGGGGGGFRVRPLGTEDGLPNLEANRGGFLRDADGDVWLGTVGGLTRIHASAAEPPRVPPRLVVTGVELPRRRLDFPTALDLAWSERAITIEVAVLDYRAPRRAGWRARLGGLDADWLPVRPTRELRYGSLPAGEHVLELQAVDDGGTWGEVVRLPVRVRPPFWMTAWFRATALLALVALAAGVHHRRVVVLRRRNAELEAQVAARTAQIAEAHRRLQEAQGQIAHMQETSGRAQEDLSAWARAVGADIATAAGASAVGAFLLDGGRVTALGTPAGAAPDVELVERAAREGLVAEPGRWLLPIAGAASHALGVLAVCGRPAEWGEAERQLFRSFAHQLGGALELRETRRSLAAIEAARAAVRRRMADEGVPAVAVCPRCRGCQPEGTTTCPEDGAALEPPRLLPWRLRGRWRLCRVLGEGGMGTVFLAVDEQLGRDVAIKVVRPERFDDPAAAIRFEREAQALARVRHPAVLDLYDCGSLDDGSLFLITEVLAGRDLATVLLHRGPASPRQAAAVLTQAAGALGAVHRAGLLHRDVKPQNLILLPGATPHEFGLRLVDFGLARDLAAPSDLTSTGVVIGTPAYMAPEQLLGREVTPRTDLYALAVVGYECLTGERLVPLAARGGELFSAVVAGAPRLPCALLPGLDPAVDPAFARALAKDPATRPDDAEAWAAELADALSRSQGHPGWGPGFLEAPPVTALPPPDSDASRADTRA
ncbi:MAG: protein kinase [Vicinamibacteria bacterium]|nr:protein kinase [Vicinamibacteria bacterium]